MSNNPRFFSWIFLPLDNKREKIIVLTKEGKVQAGKVILPLFDYEQKAAEKISDKKIETAIEGGIILGTNASAIGDIKNSGAMEQAYNLGKAIK